MFNKERFRDRISSLGLSIGEVANLLGINEATLYRKMNGTTEFSRTEIQLLRSVLRLSVDDAEAIFFAQELAKTQVESEGGT